MEESSNHYKENTELMQSMSKEMWEASMIVYNMRSF